MEAVVAALKSIPPKVKGEKHVRCVYNAEQEADTRWLLSSSYCVKKKKVQVLINTHTLTRNKALITHSRMHTNTLTH